MIAVVDAYRHGLLNTRNVWKNVVAGFIVGIVSLPLSMAFAIASGVKPENGLYTAIVAAALVGLFGGSRVQVSGPTGAFVVILSAITVKHGLIGLQIITVMSGIILLLMGILRIGSVMKFIPYPVIVGFTSGIGVIIFTGQLKYFFGLHLTLPPSPTFLETITAVVAEIPHLSLHTTIISALSVLIIVFAKRILTVIPSPLIAMLVATGIQLFYKFDDISTIGSMFGAFPNTLPSFQMLNVSDIQISAFIGPAVTVALLGAIESLLSASTADSITGEKHHSNQELIGQGIANIVAPFFGGFASTGAIARTVTNIRQGGNCVISALASSVTLILIILLFAEYIVHVPLAALSAILCVVAFNMSDIPEFVRLARKAPWYDVLVLCLTFLFTVFTDLVIGVGVGVSFAFILFAIRCIQSGKSISSIFKKVAFEQDSIEYTPSDHSEFPNGIFYHFNGPLFFGMASKFETTLETIESMPEFIVFVFDDVPFVDMTGLVTFQKILQRYAAKNIPCYICGANNKIIKKFERCGIKSMLNEKSIFPTLQECIIILSTSKHTPELPKQAPSFKEKS